jgi:hypothetical protein
LVTTELTASESVEAQYYGDANYASATSSSTSQTVDATTSPTSVTVTGPSKVTAGSTYKATASSNGSAPIGYLFASKPAAETAESTLVTVTVKS